MARVSNLDRRVKVYREEMESWKLEHAEVMRNHDEADALFKQVQFGLFLHSQLKGMTTRTFEDARVLCVVHLVWKEASLLLLRAIEESEGRGYGVEGANDFRVAFQESVNWLQSLQHGVTALTEVIDGRGIPIDEFISQLRDTDTPNCS